MSWFKQSPKAPMVAGLFLLASAPRPISAHPYPLQNVGNNLLYGIGDKFMRRDCVQRCGADSQYCCGSGEQCYTVNNIAGCTAINGGGGYGIYTTTWTETNTFTSTVTTDWPETTKDSGGGGGGGGGVGGTCVPQHEGETACGSICCASYQYCAYSGQCSQRGEGLTTITSNGVPITTQFSAPYRVTSTHPTGTFTSAEGTATGTVVPITDEGTGGGLSGGAIAGIVIGTLAGLGLLMLLCFCCIARGLWGLIFGGKKKKERSRERVEVVEERYSRRGSRMPSAHSRRDSHGGWFGGGRPAPAAHRREEKKEAAKWLGLGAAATTLLALLNLKKDKPARKPRSTYTDSFYTYTDPSSSSSSSGGRTHRTGHTRGTRTTRHSRR